MTFTYCGFWPPKPSTSACMMRPEVDIYGTYGLSQLLLFRTPSSRIRRVPTDRTMIKMTEYPVGVCTVNQ